MAALGKEIIVCPAIPNGLPNELFTPFITFSRVNYVETGIKRAAQKAFDCFWGRSFEPNLGAAKTKDRTLHVRLAELPLFHLLIVRRFRKTPMLERLCSYEIRRVLPFPDSIRPIGFAFNFCAAIPAFFSATITAMPMPILKT